MRATQMMTEEIPPPKLAQFHWKTAAPRDWSTILWVFPFDWEFLVSWLLSCWGGGGGLELPPAMAKSCNHVKYHKLQKQPQYQELFVENVLIERAFDHQL